MQPLRPLRARNTLVVLPLLALIAACPADPPAGDDDDTTEESPIGGNGIQILDDCEEYAGTAAHRCADDGLTVLQCELTDGAYLWVVQSQCETLADSSSICWEFETDAGLWTAGCGCRSPGTSTCFDANNPDPYPRDDYPYVLACEELAPGATDPPQSEVVMDGDAARDSLIAQTEDNTNGCVVCPNTLNTIAAHTDCECSETGEIVCRCESGWDYNAPEMDNCGGEYWACDRHDTVEGGWQINGSCYYGR